MKLGFYNYQTNLKKGLAFLIVAFLSLGIFAISTAPAMAIANTTLYVATTGADNGNCSVNPCLTIQYAVGQASPGATINVAAGTYTEVGQIIIDKNLNLVGADKATTIIKPAQDTTNGGDARGWFLVPLGNTFNISNVTLDGSGHKIYAGLYYWGDGTVNNCNITGIKYNESGPDYMGRAVFIKGNVDVTNTTFTEIGRLGIQYFGGSGTASGNTYTGKGDGNWLDYAFDIDNGAVVTVENNTVTNDMGLSTGTDPNYGSPAIRVGTSYGPGTDVTITGNTFTGNTIGIAIQQAGADEVTVNAHNNNLSGNYEAGIVTYDTTNTVDATYNWWGTDVNAEIVLTISGDVTYIPYYIDASMMQLSTAVAEDGTATSNKTNPQVVIVDNGEEGPPPAVTVTVEDGTPNPSIDVSDFLTEGAGEIPQITVYSSLVDIYIPAGTTVTSSDPAWNGIMEVTITPVVLPVTPGQINTLGMALEIGFPDAKLSFDRGVKLVLTGQKDKKVGYSRTGVAFTEITTICSADTQAAGDALPVDGDCKINSGNDLVVWTKHFSTFATYSSTGIPNTGFKNRPVYIDFGIFIAGLLVVAGALRFTRNK